MEPHNFNLDMPLEALPQVGKARANDFKKLGATYVRDLLFHFPFRYEDFSNITSAAKLKISEQATVRCRVMMIQNRRSPKKHRLITEAIFSDETASIKAIWFNQPYLPKILRKGNWVYLSGTLEETFYGLHMTNPVFELADKEELIHVGRLVPIYSTRGRLTSRTIRTLMANILPAAKSLADWLPKEIKERNNFLDFPEAIANIHFPKNKKIAWASRDRLAFNELFIAQLAACRARQELDESLAPSISFNEKSSKKFVSSLPFQLTDDQRRTSWEILQDIGRPRPMNRLLQGDVGSGKTVVAALAILNTVLAGYGVIYLAPTEILASQHAKTLNQLFQNIKIKIGLLTAGLQFFNNKEISRDELEKKIEQNEVDIIIGTHTLLGNRLKFSKTGLVIVDEQHRFGVRQRKLLRDQGKEETVPHLLSMTATPIPRTLALTAYGDLDISSIRQMPKDRQIIATKIIHESERTRAYDFIKKELSYGRQGFVICPLISESDKLGVRAATSEYKKLRNIFPEFNLGLLHGKLGTREKQNVMEDFKKGQIDLLIATAVVEVGIDVPNATIMIIEGAERFGLAQLHQFRGRIGRGKFASHCFLFTEEDAADTNERLLVFARLHDGFDLAEEDLRLRGPGQIFGETQSGFPRFRIADFKNIKMIELARTEAKNLIKNDPLLENSSILQKKFSNLLRDIHLE